MSKKYGYKPKALRVDSLVKSTGKSKEDLIMEFRKLNYVTSPIPSGKDFNELIFKKAPPPPKSCDTNLERAVDEILKDLEYVEGRDYEKQYRVYGYCLDFAFQKYKLAIEPGARYWHDNKEHALDPEKDKFLSEMGWTILWFDEEDLNNKEEVKEEINREIRNLESKIAS